MPGSIRQKYLDRKARLMQKTPTQEYQILDPSHHPDLRGEFAGAKVVRRGLNQYVQLTPRQAQFYIDQGGIAPTALLAAMAAPHK